MSNRSNDYTPIDTSQICLSAQNITKIYPGTVALDNVDFEVYKGKVNVLIGENGAGKSTLMKILAGIESQSSGSIFLNGIDIKLNSTSDATANGIGMIHQELNLFPNMTVMQNIFLARENSRLGMLDNNYHNKKTNELLNRLEHPLKPETKVGDLRVGEQQIIEIAKTIALQDLHILIMDEPTSSLSTAEVDILFRVINDLKGQGVSIVYISHRLEEIMRIGDYVSILREGKMVAKDQIKNVDIPWIVRNMIGKENVAIRKQVIEKPGNELLRIESLSLPKAGGGYVLDNVSLTLKEGEILGIYGLMGAGRTELIECIMGDAKGAKGDYYFKGEKFIPKSIWHQIKRGFAHIPEDRQQQGLIKTLSIARNISLMSIWEYTTGFHIVKKKMQKSVAKTIKDLLIKAPDSNLPILSLSGGNQQKVVIGKSILTDPKILLLDEPSRGIDISAKFDVFGIVKEFASKGLGIILVASELKEIISISDRIIVLSKGKITGELSGEEISEDALVKLSTM